MKHLKKWDLKQSLSNNIFIVVIVILLSLLITILAIGNDRPAKRECLESITRSVVEPRMTMVGSTTIMTSSVVNRTECIKYKD